MSNPIVLQMMIRRRISLLAIFFLLAGASKPLCTIVGSFIEQATQEIRQLAQDASESGEEDSQDSDEGLSDEYQSTAGHFHFAPEQDLTTFHFAFYLRIFEEHHPSLLTPPPKA